MRYRVLLSIMFVFLASVVLWFVYDISCDYSGACQSVDNKSFVLFDFDGTLVDSFDATIEVCNQCAYEFNLPPITDEQKVQIRTRSLKDFINSYVKVPWYKVLFLYRRFIKLMERRINNVRLFDGISDVVKKLKEQGYRLGIISSNNVANIKTLLKKNDLDVFDVVYTDSTILSKNKIMQKFLDKFKIEHTRVVYVGDEIRDIEATRRVGIQMIAVDWGFNTREALSAYSPARVISRPAELIPALKTLGC